MTTYIGLTIGTLFISVLHFGMQPSEPKASTYQLELRVMLKSCIDNNKNSDECEVIQRVIQQANRGAK